MFLLATNGSGSSICNTLTYLCHRYDLNKLHLSNLNRKRVYHKLNNNVKPNDSVICNVEVIKDMLHFRDKQDYSVLSKCEIEALLQSLCSE